MARRARWLTQEHSEVEHELLQAFMAWWMGMLDMDPEVLIGKHIPTGGLLVLPIKHVEMNTEQLVSYLYRAIDLIRKSEED
jgi:hypothetical protein